MKIIHYLIICMVLCFASNSLFSADLAESGDKSKNEIKIEKTDTTNLDKVDAEKNAKKEIRIEKKDTPVIDKGELNSIEKNDSAKSDKIESVKTEKKETKIDKTDSLNLPKTEFNKNDKNEYKSDKINKTEKKDIKSSLSRNIHMPQSKKIKNILIMAKKDYYLGKIDEAEKKVDMYIIADPDNKEAAILKSKITRVKEKVSEIRNSMAEKYALIANSYYSQRKILDSLASVRKSLEINPSSKKAALLLAYIMEDSKRLIKIKNERDKRLYWDAINCFMERKYLKANSLFRKINEYYPEVNDCISLSMYHLLSEYTDARSIKYCKDARMYMILERYSKAKDSLDLALEMNNCNIDAQIVMEQVKLEFDDSVVVK